MALIGSSNSLGGLAGSNAVARLLVVISGDSSQLTNALGKASAETKGFGATAGQLGSALTRTVTLPFLAIGGAAIKVATDFNSALTRVAALTPILDQTGQSFAQLQDQILSLANQPDIVATPTDLANALYFAGSAGLKASDAMQVVALSAKAQSVGMGEAADVSKVLIAALNNYSSEGLTAAHAADVLTAAIKEGTAEPRDLAISLGRLLPVARQAGISFDEVAASVAALTNVGVPARVATTSLRALFSELLAPTEAATKQLDALGISADQLRFKLQQGPIEAFQLLSDATKGNVDELRQIIPQIRGLTSYYGLAGDKAEKYRGVIDAVTNSQGELDKVVAQFVQTPGFKFQKLLQQLNIAGIELGNALLPIFLKMISVLTDITNIFISLPGPVKDAVAGFLVFGAALGPLLKLYGVIAAFGEGGVAALKALSAGFITAGASAAIALGGFLSLLHGSSSLSSILATLVGVVITVTLALKGLQTLLLANASLALANNFTVLIASLSGPEIAAAAVTIGAVVTAVGYLAGRSARASAAVSQMGKALTEGARSGQTLADTLNQISSERLRTQLQGLASSLNLLSAPTGQGLAKLQPAIGNNLLFALKGTQQILHQFPNDASAAQVQIDKVTAALTDAASKGKNLTAAFIEAGGATGDFGSALDQVIALGQESTLDQVFDVGDSAQNIKDLSAELLAAKAAIDDYNNATVVGIQLSNENSDAVQQLAHNTGTSVDFIQRGLDQYGVNLAIASKDTINQWERAYFGVDKNGKLIQASVAETDKETRDALNSMADAVSGAFDIFSKIKTKDATKPFDVYLQRIRDVNVAQTQLVGDMASLARRGVSSELTQAILGSLGPQGIHRFATATDKQLKEYVRAFEVNMALGDKEVLKEGVHLEGKAHKNISKFAAATLNAGKILPGVAQTVIGKMTQGFEQGNVQDAGFDLMTTFVNGVQHSKNITAKAANQAVIAMANELTDKHNYDKDGQVIMQQVAQGISQATGIPIRQVDIMMGFVSQAMKRHAAEVQAAAREAASKAALGLKQGFGDAAEAGRNFMDSFINAIKSKDEAAKNAAYAAAHHAKDAFQSGLQNSPMFGSYYNGIEFAKQFDQGVRRQGFHTSTPTVGRQATFGGWSGKGTASGTQKTKLYISRTRVSKEIAHESDYSGH